MRHTGLFWRLQQMADVNLLDVIAAITSRYDAALDAGDYDGARSIEGSSLAIGYCVDQVLGDLSLLFQLSAKPSESE